MDAIQVLLSPSVEVILVDGKYIRWSTQPLVFMLAVLVKSKPQLDLCKVCNHNGIHVAVIWVRELEGR